MLPDSSNTASAADHLSISHDRLSNHPEVMVRMAYAEVCERLADVPDSDLHQTLLGGLVAWSPEEAIAAGTLLSALPGGDEEAAINLVVQLQQLVAAVEDLPHLWMCFEQVCLATVQCCWMLGEVAEFALLGLVNEEHLPDLVRAKAGYSLTRASFPAIGWPEVLETIARSSNDERARITATIALEDLRTQGIEQGPYDVDTSGV